MKIIIDIPEDEVNECKMQVDMIKQEGFLIESLNTALKIHVANGIPLPKGHGRLIILSEDVVKKQQKPLSFSCQKWISEVGLSNATVTIIEADKESEE